MQPTPTYETLPVVFDTADRVEIPNPTIDSGYGEGVALPTEHFSWLNYKITQKITELASTCTSLITEMNNYLVSQGVTPSGALYTQFQTALAAQIAGASVASAATATSAGQCTGNSSTATKLAVPRTITLTGNASGSTSFDGSGNVSINVTNSTAANAGAVSGINFSVGVAGSNRSLWTLSPSERLIIPAGTYIMTCTTPDHPRLSMRNDVGNWSSPSGSSFIGFIVSDGVNFSIINTSGSSIAVEYRKLA